MNKAEKLAIKTRGRELLRQVEANPEDYECMLGCYCGSNALFSRLIRWWTKTDPEEGASHLSTVYVHRGTGIPFCETHALEGHGVIATDFGAVCNDSTTVIVRRVRGGLPTERILAKNIPILGCKYQMPVFEFVSRSRKDDPNKWFCSEKCNMNFDLQNRLNVLVSPAWGAASDKVRVIYGRYTNEYGFVRA